MSESIWRREQVERIRGLVDEAQSALADDDANRRWQLVLGLRRDALAAAEAMLDIAMRVDAYFADLRFDAALAELRGVDTIVVPVDPTPPNNVVQVLSGSRPGTIVLHAGRTYRVGDLLTDRDASILASAGWTIETRRT